MYTVMVLQPIKKSPEIVIYWGYKSENIGRWMITILVGLYSEYESFWNIQVRLSCTYGKSRG